MEGLTEGGEERQPPWLGPGRGPGGGGIRDDECFDLPGVSLKPVLKDRHRAGERRGRGDERGELGEDSLPVSFRPIGGWIGRAESRGAERNYNRNVIGTRGRVGGVPFVEGRG